MNKHGGEVKGIVWDACMDPWEPETAICRRHSGSGNQAGLLGRRGSTREAMGGGWRVPQDPEQVQYHLGDVKETSRLYTCKVENIKKPILLASSGSLSVGDYRSFQFSF